MVELMEDLHEFHSQNVDPSEISVSMAFYQLLHSEEALKKCPQVRWPWCLAVPGGFPDHLVPEEA